MLRVRLLGEVEFRDDRGRLPGTDGGRVQSLLAYLVLHPDAPQPRRRLACLLWPDSSETQARTNLRQLLHLLRHTAPDVERPLDVTPSDRNIARIAELARAGAAMSEERGITLWGSLAEFWLGCLEARRGRPEAGVDRIGVGLAGLDATGHTVLQTQGRWLLAEAQALAGLAPRRTVP